jgi:hypothetical protein
MSEDTGSKVTAESYGALKVEDAQNDCWMIRVPPSLAETWDKTPEGTVLGELVFTKGGKTPGGMTIKPQLGVEVSSEISGDDPTLPLLYSLQAMTKKIPVMHPVVRHSNGSVSMKGTVSRTANLQVQSIHDSNYRQLSKNRLLHSTVNSSRFVKPVESNQVINQSRPKATSGFGKAVHQYGKRLLETANQPTLTKKAKFADDQPTRSVIFSLFSQQQYWTVKDLKHASGGRPETEIRDVLRELGDYHRSGDHKNTWELRKEFQNKTQTLEGSI